MSSSWGHLNWESKGWWRFLRGEFWVLVWFASKKCHSRQIFWRMWLHIKKKKISITSGWKFRLLVVGTFVFSHFCLVRSLKNWLKFSIIKKIGRNFRPLFLVIKIMWKIFSHSQGGRKSHFQLKLIDFWPLFSRQRDYWKSWIFGHFLVDENFKMIRNHGFFIAFHFSVIGNSEIFINEFTIRLETKIMS